MFDRIVLHIPHSSAVFPFGEECWDDGIGAEIRRWTDWHTDTLFGLDNPRIVPVIYPYSRFYCDAERLLGDPLEAVGQGIVYRNFAGLQRRITNCEAEAVMRSYHKHIARLRRALGRGRPLLIDCHSFPADLSDIEICIGFNEDWSKPEEMVRDLVASRFSEAGYKVGINTPYSNSISPACSFAYPSLMIEVNKRVYMNDETEINEEGFKCLRKTIQSTYSDLIEGLFFPV